MNILYLAYASEPGKGSERGVGWNVPLAYAQSHGEDGVYVLTRGTVRARIEEELAVSAPPNLHFLFYDIPSWMTYPDEARSRWGEQINYLLWQVLARRKVREIVRTRHIGLIHHLTFNQYRTPSPGFWTDVPFVMGPIGGAELIAPCFDQDLSQHTLHKERIRRKGRDLPVFGWFTRRRKNKKMILFSSRENLDRLEPFCSPSCGVRVMPAIACRLSDFALPERLTEETGDGQRTFSMVYAGNVLDWKGLHIFLRAVRRAFDDNGIRDFKALLVGVRFSEEQRMAEGWIRELGLEGRVELIPFMERKQLLEVMAHSDLSVYPAFRDSGSMSVLEACALGCPTICFNAGGQDAFPDDTLFKVDIGKSYEDTLDAFAQRLLWIYHHRGEAASVGARAKDFVEHHMTWKGRVADFHEIYHELTSSTVWPEKA